MFGAGRRVRDKLDRLPMAVMMATFALILAQPVGLLVQERDVAPIDAAQWQHKAGPAPDVRMLDEMAVAAIDVPPAAAALAAAREAAPGSTDHPVTDPLGPPPRVRGGGRHGRPRIMILHTTRAAVDRRTSRRFLAENADTTSPGRPLPPPVIPYGLVRPGCHRVRHLRHDLHLRRKHHDRHQHRHQVQLPHQEHHGLHHPSLCRHHGPCHLRRQLHWFP